MNGENFYVYKKRQPKRLVLIFSSIIILKLAFSLKSYLHTLAELIYLK